MSLALALKITIKILENSFNKCQYTVKYQNIFEIQFGAAVIP